MPARSPSKLEFLRDVAQTAISLTGALGRFLPTNLGDAQDKRFQLLEPEGRVLDTQ